MSGPPCSVRVALESMTGNERVLFTRAVDRTDVSKADVARALRDVGHHRVSAWVLRQHARGECSCRFTKT